MNKLTCLLPMALLCLSLASKASDTVSPNGLNPKNLDLSAKPGTDFFRYATGGWCDANPIPDEFSRYGSFDKLQDENQKQIQELIVELGSTSHAPGSSAQKIGDMYRVGTDSVKLNSDGAKPIQDQLKAIQSIKTREDVVRMVVRLHQEGAGAFFGLYVGPDDKNSNANLLQFSQGGLGMGERDYYLQKDESSKELRHGYLKLIETQFVNAGFSQVEAIKASKSVLKTETTLAKAHFTKEKVRIPELNYHKFSTSQLNDSVAAFPWKLLFESAGVEGLKEVNICEVAPIATSMKLMQSAPIVDLKAYLTWRLLDASAVYLSDPFVHANFDFYGKQLSGAKVLRPRWKRVLGSIDNTLGEEVGKLYTAKYFPAQAKERMLKLVENLRVSLGERITGLTWMSDETKAKALEKLNAIVVKIGYPDKWKDYSALEIGTDSYWANICRANRFEYNFNFGKLGKPVDKTEWQMFPQTVNAYYNPTTNEICFPAGILQPPFFYMNADDAVNYGAIGVVIGHEMTHGFDDQGCKYDKDGNMSDWWKPIDATQFAARTKVLAEYFDKIIVINDMHANGEYTLGENIADHGGLQVARNAFLKTEQGLLSEPIDGFTPQQRFFLSYANLWAGNLRDAEIIRLTKLDPHSLGKWRVNGALPHISAWYDAFGITPADPMYLPLESRVSIW
jgi:putative endopeptidase